MKVTIRNFFQIVLMTIALLFIGSPLFAQIISEDSLKVKLDEIRVEAAHSSITIGKAPLSLSYLVRESSEITARPASTMDELTFSLPGIFISNRENYALGERLTIRGLGWRSQFGVRGAQIILDDIPLTVADGQTIMNMIDPAMVHRIELLRGPSATFWGNSSGGVLHLSTRPPADSHSLQYRGYTGSHSTHKQELRWNLSSPGARFYGYATYFNTEGFRDHSAARLFRASAGAERALSDHSRIRFTGIFAAMPKAQHPGSLTKAHLDEDRGQARDLFVNTATGKTFTQAMLSGSYLHNFDGGFLNISAHGTYRDLHNPLLFRYVGLERYAGGARATYQFHRLPFDLSIGTESKIQQDERFVTNNINGRRGDQVQTRQTETVTNLAFFTRTSLPVSDRFSLNAGIRTDWLAFKADDDLDTGQQGSRYFFSANPTAGFSYQSDHFTLFGNFSTSFESPTTTELVNRPDGTTGFNQNLSPEKTIGFETGIRGLSSTTDISYDVTLFAMTVNDIILPFEDEDIPGVTFFRNEGTTFHYGMETSVHIILNSKLDLRWMLSLLQAEFSDRELKGNTIPGVSPFRLGSIISYRPGNHHFGLDTEWVGQYHVDNTNSDRNPAYLLFNLRWTTELTLGKTSLWPFFSVNNLLDNEYNTSVAINAAGNHFFEPGSGRSFRFGFQFNLP